MKFGEHVVLGHLRSLTFVQNLSFTSIFGRNNFHTNLPLKDASDIDFPQ